MDGKDYIAAVRLSTKDDQTLALPGETCERVPAASLSWLVNQGLIAPILRTGESVLPRRAVRRLATTPEAEEA